jgi:uncharacterized membrane protein
MSKSHFTTKQLATAGIIAAIYAVLSLFSSVFGIAYGPIQCRFSEALTVLPFFLPEAIPGLFIGCLVSNLMSTVGPLDLIFGSLATLLAAGGMWLLRNATVKGYPRPALLLPALTNALLVGWELMVYIGGGFWINALYVAIGEAAVLLTLGSALYYALKVRHLDRKLFA